jgi:predicted acyltransferase (DUF342 family)
MNPWPFVIFALFFAVLVYAHFMLAYRSWRISRWDQATDIDQNYVRLEDYAARSFRAKVTGWLSMPHLASKPDGTRRIRKGTETIIVTESSEYPPQSDSDDILIAHRTFKCQAGCVFNREIYAGEDAVIGAGTHLQAIAADGNLTLGSHVRIVRWADCHGAMEIGSDSLISYRATAGGKIRLHRGVRAKSVFAPIVSSGGFDAVDREIQEAPPTPKVEIPPSETQPSVHGLDLDKLSMLNRETWIYYGDLELSEPFHLRAALVVRGGCIVPPGSILDRDIKSKKSISIGKDSICRGNIIAEEDVHIGQSCRFYGIVHAGRKLHLSAGVCGGDERTNVAVFAEETLTIEENVTIHGKLASDAFVEVAPEFNRQG